MARSVRTIAWLLLCGIVTSDASQQVTSAEKIRDHAMTIALTKWEVSQDNVVFDFTLRNDSQGDVWFCDSINAFGSVTYEVFVDPHDPSIVVRRRLGVSTTRNLYVSPTGRYVRLRAGETRDGSMSLSVPVQMREVFASFDGGRGIQCSTRITVEIGFYAENLPKKIQSILSEAERMCVATSNAVDCNDAVLEEYFPGCIIWKHMGGVAGFSEMNRNCDLEKEVFVPYTFGSLRGEQCSKLVIDGISLAYQGGELTW
jgi:hypothetical protein